MSLQPEDKMAAAKHAAEMAAQGLGLNTDFGGLTDSSPAAPSPVKASPEILQQALNLPPRQGPAEEGLTEEELQSIREIISANARKKKDEFILPDLPVTDEERDRFGDCMANAKVFRDECSMLKGKLKAVFRTKTKRENDILFQQLEADFKEGRIVNEPMYVTLLNNYNLLIQMESLQGVACPQVIPKNGVPLPPSWSLHNIMKQSSLENMPEPYIFMLLGALTQFDRRVKVLSQEAMTENFTNPAGVS